MAGGYRGGQHSLLLTASALTTLSSKNPYLSTLVVFREKPLALARGFEGGPTWPLTQKRGS